MKIYWYDRGYMHQSFAVPYLPTEQEALMAYSPGVKHAAPNVVGCENWRVPVLHRLLDDGHELVWGSSRDIMPSADIDFDLNRLAWEYGLEGFVRETDPMLGVPVWDVHHDLEAAYMERFPAGREKPEGKRGVDPGDENYTLGWLREMIETAAFGKPPEVDVAIIAIIRGNVIAGFEQTYVTAQYLRMGVPVLFYDQDRQLAATANSLTKTGHAWPNPGILIAGPYVVGYKWGDSELIDFPYVPAYEQWWDANSVWGRKEGVVYVGNDYERRKLMETYMLPLTGAGMQVHVWGKFDGKDADEFKAKWPDVDWAGRIETNRALSKIAAGKLTVNLIKHNYQKLGQITMRTCESLMAGTVQMGIAENIRIREFVPPWTVAASTAQAMDIARRVDGWDEEHYLDALDEQRQIVRGRLDIDGYYMPRLYELVDKCRIECGDRGTRVFS